MKTLIQRRYEETTSSWSKEWYASFMAEHTCPTCQGKRLNEQVLSVQVGGLNISEFTDMSIEKVYYPNDGSYFTVSSPKELHDKLVKDITNIFEKIQGKPTENKTVTYKLNDNSKIGYTKNDDLLHVNVTKTETTPDQSKELNKDITETQYDLCIPTSSVFFFVKSDTLKVTYMKEENTLLDLSRGVTYLNFDIGIQGQAMSEKFTKENLMIGIKQQPIKAGTTQININTVLTALG